MNLIDSVEGYGNGHREVVTGRALKGRRGKWIGATKVQPNRGLRVLGPVDVLQIGYNLLEQSADALLRWAKEEEIQHQTVEFSNIAEIKEREDGSVSLQRGALIVRQEFPGQAEAERFLPADVDRRQEGIHVDPQHLSRTDPLGGEWVYEPVDQDPFPWPPLFRAWKGSFTSSP